MFTGIVQATGTIAGLDRSPTDVRVKVEVGELDMSDVQLGDSIATNGVCLTVVAFDQGSFIADVSIETLEKTAFAHYQVGQTVNLEKALTLNTRLGGHLVSGHVDAVGKITAMQAVGRATEYWVEIPADITKYIAVKGSITIDGISLTVNDIKQQQFKLTIVPHTEQQTTVNQMKIGQQVNVEVDIIARYLERLMMPQAQSAEPSISESFLAKHGFIK